MTHKAMPRDSLLLLTTDSIPLIGGVADYLHNLCIETAASADVTVFSTVHGSNAADAQLPYSMRQLPDTRMLGQRPGDGFSFGRKLNTLVWLLRRRSEARKLLLRIVKELSPQHVFIGRWEESSHHWCAACRSLGISYGLFAYGMELTERKTPSWEKHRRDDFREATIVVSISSATTEKLEGFGVFPERIVLLPPGIRPELFEPLPRLMLSSALDEAGIPDRPFLFSLCRLVPRKGIDLAMRAFADISREMPELIYVIAGTGPEEQGLRAIAGELQLRDRIIFTGAVDDLTKRALLQRCELFVMPNRPLPGDMEGFGIVFLEAALFGRAVIGGNNGGVPDAVVNGQTGLLIDTSSSHVPLLDAMATLLRQPDLARRLGETARQRALKEFNWVHLAAGLLRHLDNGHGTLPLPADPAGTIAGPGRRHAAYHSSNG
jgi:glycosyltransferase involved in cell wall biosynthesis